ncbi:MAG: hypothetical protein DRQ89_12580 [Epsilonproteobacteria bacterium]|nr:MAG: hypothetical protein DRQ89_12580 [Campylobacterota bacterium]
MKEFENYKTAVVSTAHLPEELAAKMEREEFVKFNYAKISYGFLIWIPTGDLDDYLHEWPEEIRPLMVEAHKQGCKFVDFDQGGTVYDFRTWEW